jgi:hypothetical protein
MNAGLNSGRIVSLCSSPLPRIRLPSTSFAFRHYIKWVRSTAYISLFTRRIIQDYIPALGYEHARNCSEFALLNPFEHVDLRLRMELLVGNLLNQLHVNLLYPFFFGPSFFLEGPTRAFSQSIE